MTVHDVWFEVLNSMAGRGFPCQFTTIAGRFVTAPLESLVIAG